MFYKQFHTCAYKLKSHTGTTSSTNYENIPYAVGPDVGASEKPKIKMESGTHICGFLVCHTDLILNAMLFISL